MKGEGMPKLTSTEKVRRLREAVSGCLEIFDTMRDVKNIVQLKDALAAISAASKRCTEVLRICKED
jgi:hypothetical protein